MKNKYKLLFVSILSVFLLSGCWNYREIEELVIVGGAAIDKDDNGQYQITVETIQIASGTDSEITSKPITITGKTIFDAARNYISQTGKKLYWSHAKTLILSEEVAKEGIIKLLDWFERDSETRSDINILISKEKSAKEILTGEKAESEIKALELDETLKNQDSLGKSPRITLWKVINDIAAPGISAILPVVEIKNGMSQNMGTAIFRKDKLIGFLDEEQSQTLLFIRNQIKGGLLIIEDTNNKFPISMEIFKNITKIEPKMKNNNITFHIKLDTTLALDELGGTSNYLDDEESLHKLKKDIEDMLNNRVKSLVALIQSEYRSDIFGFGGIMREEDFKHWKQVENDWENHFEKATVNVTSNVRIKNSGMLADPLKIGD